METFGIYLLKSAVWLTGFTLVFLTVLRNERYFQLNRIYLLSGIVASLVFPLYTWHYAVIIPSEPTGNISLSGISAQVIDASTPSIPIYYWFYAMGIGWLAFRLIWQTVKVIRKLRKAGYEVNGSVKLVRTPDYAASFSFFSYVFVNPSTSDVETREIVNHEREHIEQRHWFDLLLAEFLCMLQWFNPLVWVYAHLIRQNHEYLADEKALQRTSDPAIYRATLLNQLLGVPVISLANSFSYSLNKKRFKMMKKSIHSPFRKLRLLLVLPLMALVFYAFAKPEFITASDLKAKSDFVNLIKDSKYKKGSVAGTVVNADGKPLAGTSVILRGSTLGTTTDENGNFKLTDVPLEGELVFSYVGYETVLTKAEGENPRQIKMERASVGIDKVVVEGYGETKSEPFSPSEMSLIVKPPYHYDPGQQVAQLEKDFIKSKSDNPPLIFLDGEVITKSKMESINPDDIGVIKALKDQSATNKYGDKGKFGVIEIVSKSKMTGEENGKSANSITFDDPKKEPLIYVDGKITDYKTMRAIGPDLIESINVLKGEHAIAKYGEKGKNGALELSLKKGDTKTPGDVVVGYGKKVDAPGPVNKNGFIINSKQSDNASLIFLDGVIIDKAKMDAINPETIESVNVLKDKTATDKYGEKGKNGAIEVTLKKGTTAGVPEDKYFVGYPITNHLKTTSSHLGVNLAAGDATVVGYGKTADLTTTTSPLGLNLRTNDPKNPPLYLLDGVIIDKAKMDAINPETIESITVLKDKSATIVYGDKGKDGVILITSKKNGVSNQPTKVVQVEGRPLTEEVDQPFVMVEQMPQFPGGEQAMMKFIVDNVKYPKGAKENGITGTVIVNFVINRNGEINHVRVMRAIGGGCDEEAVRVVSMMPKWSPGFQGGQPVNVSYTIPIKFALDGNGVKKEVVDHLKKSEEPFVVVEEMPQYVGGFNELMKFLGENIKYPAQAKAGNIQGTVVVSFIIKSSGKVEESKIVKGVQADMDAESLRVIGLMPDWQPGKQQGKAVDVAYTLPIQFKLK